MHGGPSKWGGGGGGGGGEGGGGGGGAGMIQAMSGHTTCILVGGYSDLQKYNIYYRKSHIQETTTPQSVHALQLN